MWTDETSIDVNVTAARVWVLFADVAGWTRWNAGIARIELRGPFADGTTFLMQPPGMEPFVSTLAEVRPNASFIDVTVMGDTTVRVHHGLRAIGDRSTRVTFRADVTGPDAAEIGPMVTADFADVLRALKQLAESGLDTAPTRPADVP